MDYPVSPGRIGHACSVACFLCRSNLAEYFDGARWFVTAVPFSFIPDAALIVTMTNGKTNINSTKLFSLSYQVDHSIYNPHNQLVGSGTPVAKNGPVGSKISILRLMIRTGSAQSSIS